MQLISEMLQTHNILLVSEVISITIKLFLLASIIYYSQKAAINKKLTTFLCIILIGEASCDIAWFLHIIKYYHIHSLTFQFVTCIIRISWALCIVEYFCLGLFIKNIAKNKSKLSYSDLFFLFISLIAAGYYIYLAFFNYNVSSNIERPYLEMMGIKLILLFEILFPLPIIWNVLRTIKQDTLPKILQHQLKIFIFMLVLPKLIFEIINNDPLTLFWPFFAPIVPPGNYLSVSISTILMTYAIYFSARKMMGLRFLNFTSHVQEPQPAFDFINDFKTTLEQLGLVVDVNELKHITQNFFKDAFEIPAHNIQLYIRSLDIPDNNSVQEAAKITESFISTLRDVSPLGSLLYQEKILIKDELEFTQFYENKSEYTVIINFLNALNAEIFIPIFEKQIIIGYIIIEKGAREQLYTATERDEMLVFTSYLANIINLLKHRNLDALLIQEKELKEELYNKHQEINQYKESIRSFLRNSQERKIGIVFYKGRRFSFGNQAARELIDLDLNYDEGHPLVKHFKNIIRQVTEYKTAQTVVAYAHDGKKVIISGIPSLEDNYIIITVYYPEIADIIKLQADLLKDPSQWDYLLYLETTQSGQLINQLIPGTGEQLLHFKINLLKIALNRRAPLLTMPQADLLPTVEIVHQISLRQTLQTLKLVAPEKNSEIALKLFGYYDIMKQTHQESMLEKLTHGTLYIENVHFLSMETQRALAEFLKYGFFHRFKSDHKIMSSVRIICSTHKNLTALLHEGTFSQELFNELNKMVLTLPPLTQLPHQEVLDLADKYVEQAIKVKAFSSLLYLHDKEKEQIINQPSLSLHELKERIHTALAHKTHAKKLDTSHIVDSGPALHDPKLVDAARLGKHALKDQDIMVFLWDTFKNQTKIATLLGVNRSSVNRRCKEYHLIGEDEP